MKYFVLKALICWKIKSVFRDLKWCLFTRRQINLYRMFFANFSVNSLPIFMKFCKVFFRVTRRLPWKYWIVKKLDHLACNTIQG